MSAFSEQEKDKRESINKSRGLNASEEYLAQLCEKTFLSLWSYPNLFRTPAKELADLIVVFGNDILIFSDKHCEYPKTEDANLNWNRWFKKAVLKSAKQLWGAENWIKKYPDRIFLDAKCNKIFPFQINTKNSRVHLILVARGVSDASKIYFKGGSGSLILKSFIKGEASHTEPFNIGDLDPDKTFIHIFDDITLDVIMSALDTIKDFTAYLSKKELLFRSNKIIAATGEEDLLPFYLSGLINNEHDFEFPKTSDALFINEGHWKMFNQNPQRKAQLIENEKSLLWDHIIERFNIHALKGTQYVVSSGGIRDSEIIMRFFASESRLSRRMLSKGLGDLILKTPKNVVGRRVAMPFNKEGVYYIFIVFPRMGRTDEEYRLMRSEYLTWCCLILRARYPMAQDIIGFATESGVANEFRSEDAIYFDGRIWNDEMQNQAEKISKKLNIMLDPKPYRVHVQEYPEIVKPSSKKTAKVGRNDPCPCGSGKKFKRCHGR